MMFEIYLYFYSIFIDENYNMSHLLNPKNRKLYAIMISMLIIYIVKKKLKT